MSIQDRITYDSAELIQMLENELDRFNVFRFDGKYRTLLGAPFQEKLEKWITAIRSQKDSPLTLVVCGEFKRGKSSLINALLGEKVVTTNVTTETITTNKISYGPHANELVLSGGKRIKLSDEELSCAKLRDILKELPEQTFQLELKRPIAYLKEVTIIDTPGLGDAMQNFSAEVGYALQQADAVVYVYSVAYPLSMQERLFVRTAIKPQRYTELFLVGNFADTLDSTEDCLRIAQTSAERLGDLLPGETPLLLSALDEQCRQMQTDPPNPQTAEYLQNNFAQFRKELSELLVQKRDCIIPDRIERLTQNMLQDLERDLEVLSRGLEMDENSAQAQAKALNARIASLSEEQKKAFADIDKLSDTLTGDTVGWLGDFLAKMESDVDSLNNIPADDIKKYYVLYCTETLQSAIEKCNAYFIDTVYDALDDIVSDFSKPLLLGDSTLMPKFHLSLQNKTWTKGDNVAFAASALGLSNIPLLSTAVDFVAGTMRQKKIEQSTPDIIAEIKRQYAPLKASALQVLSENYAAQTDKIKEQVSEYFEEQRAAVEENAERTAAVACQDAKHKQKIRLAVEEVRQCVQSIKAHFSNMHGNADAQTEG